MKLFSGIVLTAVCLLFSDRGALALESAAELGADLLEQDQVAQNRELARPIPTCSDFNTNKRNCKRKGKRYCVWIQGDGDTISSECKRLKRVFFVGNSFTVSKTNIPKEFEKIVRAAKDEKYFVQSRTKGGYNIRRHVSEGTHLTANEQFDSAEDFIVLQDQSQHLALGTGFWRGRSKPYFKDFRDTATNGQTVLFYQTWGYLNGDKGNWGSSDTYDRMQDRIIEGYEQMSSEIPDTRVCPIGRVWKKVYEYYGDNAKRLYKNDGRHQGNPGAYLAAATMYACITGKSPVGNPYKGKKMSAAQRLFIQQTIEDEVLN